MRLLKIRGARALWAVAAILAPGAGFAQSNSFLQTYCTPVNSYTQYCEYFEGQSSLTIGGTGQITVNAVTEAMWGFLVNMTGCEDSNDGNPNACQPPSYPTPAAYVYSVISPGNASSSSSSGCGVACAQLQFTSQATQAGTYTETSQHEASYPPSGDELYGYTQAQQQYSPPQPTVSSVSPSTWQAGQTTSVTITGSNLGSSPTVTMSGDSYLTWTQSSANASGTQIVGTVTISASDPGGETVDIAVTAGGSGNGFAEGEKQGAQSNTATATVAPSCPSSVSIFRVTPIPLAANMYACPGPAGSCSNFPNYLTGVGIETIMQLNPIDVDWSKMSLQETVTTDPNSNCPTAPACGGAGGLVPGTRPYNYAYGQLVDQLPTSNTNAYFFDWHTLMYATDILGPANRSSCTDICHLAYSCGTTPIGSFTITKSGSHATIQNTPVTVMSVTKQ